MMGNKIIFWAAAALAVCFGVMAAEAENFIVTHTLHECTGEGCLVCLQIQLEKAFTRQPRNMSAHIPAFLYAAAGFFVLGSAVFYRAAATAVAFKVRLNR